MAGTRRRPAHDALDPHRGAWRADLGRGPLDRGRRLLQPPARREPLAPAARPRDPACEQRPGRSARRFARLGPERRRARGRCGAARGGRERAVKGRWLDSASGLRPLSAFLVVALVLALVGARSLWLVARNKPGSTVAERVQHSLQVERDLPPAWTLVDADGRPLALSQVRLDLI